MEGGKCSSSMLLFCSEWSLSRAWQWLLIIWFMIFNWMQFSSKRWTTIPTTDSLLSDTLLVLPLPLWRALDGRITTCTARLSLSALVMPVHHASLQTSRTRAITMSTALSTRMTSFPVSISNPSRTWLVEYSAVQSCWCLDLRYCLSSGTQKVFLQKQSWTLLPDHLFEEGEEERVDEYAWRVHHSRRGLFDPSLLWELWTMGDVKKQHLEGIEGLLEALQSVEIHQFRLWQWEVQDHWEAKATLSRNALSGPWRELPESDYCLIKYAVPSFYIQLWKHYWECI